MAGLFAPFALCANPHRAKRDGHFCRGSQVPNHIAASRPSLPAKSMTAEEISKKRLTIFDAVCYIAYRAQKCAICIISFTLHII